MNFDVDHNQGEDFAAIEFHPSPDDDVTFTLENGRPVVRLALFAWEARELIEMLTTLAAERE